MVLSRRNFVTFVGFMLLLRLLVKRASKNYSSRNVPEQPVKSSQNQPALVKSTSNRSLTAGVTNLFETESYFLVRICAKGYQLDAHFWNKILLNFSSIMLS